MNDDDDEPDYQRRRVRHRRIAAVVHFCVYMLVAVSMTVSGCLLLNRFGMVSGWGILGSLVVGCALGTLPAIGCRAVVARILRSHWPEAPDDE